MNYETIQAIVYPFYPEDIVVMLIGISFALAYAYIAIKLNKEEVHPAASVGLEPEV